jgi:hypothetical protein
LSPGDRERQQGKAGGGNRGPAVNGRQTGTAVDERTDAKGGDPVSDLVERDHPAGHCCRHRGQGILAEADRQREEGGAAKPSQPEGGDTEPRRVVGKGRDQQEGGDEHDRQQVKDDLCGQPAHDASEQQPADGDHGSERGQGQRRLSRRRAQ